jgi:ribosome maturation factor RimP
MERTDLEQQLERQIEQLGFELVELDLAGSRNRPLVRLRIDRPGSEPGHGVTIEDCTRVSRALERYLETQGETASRYLLEVSSPGVERPLHRRRDFERFAGREIGIRTEQPIGQLGKRIEGVLRGVRDDDQGEQVLVELPNDELISIARRNIVRAHLIFRWDD